ncbi:hypothetical protein NDU88_005894 [Pleurodeles waltl]|uniref:Uncharacterized protein n=1 Tax=Pleurodeles waltl TaxID=8319 RepID=A0AAV7WZX9_PLEWA|nr:hypothetical protein NDU88_005894 [Pleurodeles waltl]
MAHHRLVFCLVASGLALPEQLRMECLDNCDYDSWLLEGPGECNMMDCGAHDLHVNGSRPHLPLHARRVVQGWDSSAFTGTSSTSATPCSAAVSPETLARPVRGMKVQQNPAGRFRLLWSLLVLRFQSSSGWHDLDNCDYDCWPLEGPDEFNMMDCGGLEMAWVSRPPEKAISGVAFSVIYAVTASDRFYDYAVENGILSYSNADDAKTFCEEQKCPSNWKDANAENCCVHHANIHSCPLAFMRKGGICGPWIPDDGQIFTHTTSTAGTMTQTNWTAKLVLIHVGLTSLIAHIRVGRMQVALEAKTTVLPAVVCGDAVCEESEGCSTCPADCGTCALPTDARIGIALPISVICTGFILTLVSTVAQVLFSFILLDLSNLCLHKAYPQF